MTGSRAAAMRALRATMARAARSARGSRRPAPSKSKALIMSMIRSALAAERGIQRAREGGLAADERLPRELEALALALGHELDAFGAERDHVGLPLDRDLAAQRFFQFRRHAPATSNLQACRFSSRNRRAISGSW